MSYITVIKIVLTLLPLIIDAVKAIEAALPETGQGQQKLEALKSILQHAYEAGSGILVKFDELWPVLQKTIGSVVTLFNAAGAFRK